MSEQKKQNQANQGQNQTQSKSAEQLAAEQKAAEEKEKQEKAAAEAKKADEKIEDNYEEYIKLQFIVFDGGKLKEQYVERLKKLESAVKAYKGKIAIKTVTAAVGTHVLKMVEGMPVPPSYLKILKDNDVISIYVK